MNARRIGILVNPISGSGRSAEAAQALRVELEQQGYVVAVELSKPSYQPEELRAFLASLDLLIVAGGDGTLRGVLELLSETQVPVYMLPTGNESLFAKEFAMSSSSAGVLRALREGRVSEHYFARINQAPFFSMASAGLDSEVVDRIASRRKGPIGHLGYLAPIFKALWRHRAPMITLRVDGELVVRDLPGFLVVANTKQYALRFYFVPEADSSCEELCGRFFPYKNIFQLLAWCLRCGLGKIVGNTRAPLVRGTVFELEVEGGYPVQADGESVGRAPVKISVAEKCIRVLQCELF